MMLGALHLVRVSLRIYHLRAFPETAMRACEPALAPIRGNRSAAATLDETAGEDENLSDPCRVLLPASTGTDRLRSRTYEAQAVRDRPGAWGMGHGVWLRR